MDKDTRRYLSRSMQLMQAELELWRENYPRAAPGMREEAQAKVSGREPRHLPPMMFG